MQATGDGVIVGVVYTWNEKSREYEKSVNHDTTDDTFPTPDPQDFPKVIKSDNLEKFVDAVAKNITSEDALSYLLSPGGM